MKGRIEQPLSPARWEKLMKFYQLFFGFFFLIFALVLYWDHVFALGTLFLTDFSPLTASFKIV